MLKLRQAVVQGGPDNGGSWNDLGEGRGVAAVASLTTTPVLTPIKIVPKPSTVLAGGLSVADVVAAGQAICRLEAAQMVTISDFALQATEALGILVVRLGVIVGGTFAFGWRSTAAFTPTLFGATPALGGDAGVPAFTAGVPRDLPPVAANTALVNGQLPLRPSDSLWLVQAAQTGTISSVPQGIIQAGVN